MNAVYLARCSVVKNRAGVLLLLNISGGHAENCILEIASISLFAPLSTPRRLNQIIINNGNHVEKLHAAAPAAAAVPLKDEPILEHRLDRIAAWLKSAAPSSALLTPITPKLADFACYKRLNAAVERACVGNVSHAVPPPFAPIPACAESMSIGNRAWNVGRSSDCVRVNESQEVGRSLRVRS